MTTQAQISANTKNALKSTGPRTLQGKTISSHNACKHGILCKEMLLSDEKRKELEAFIDIIYQALCPQGAIEELLADKIVNAAWRLRRVIRAESGIFSNSISDFGLHLKFRGIEGDGIQSLSRYESSLEKILYKALHELQRAQAMRLGLTVISPMVVDVQHDA